MLQTWQYENNVFFKTWHYWYQTDVKNVDSIALGFHLVLNFMIIGVPKGIDRITIFESFINEKFLCFCEKFVLVEFFINFCRLTEVQFIFFVSDRICQNQLLNRTTSRAWFRTIDIERTTFSTLLRFGKENNTLF